MKATKKYRKGWLVINMAKVIDWDDCTPLTREEFDSFISTAIPFIKDMEIKNSWDFFVNDMSIGCFCEGFIIHAFALNDYEDYQKHNTKVKDMLTMQHILVKADWTEEDETLRKNKYSEIWKLVLNKVNAIADSVL